MENLGMNFWRGKRVFVTGATGLLGSALVRNLLGESAHVVVLVRDWVPQSELVLTGDLARCTVVRGEIEDADLMIRALNEHEIDTVFHLGAQTIVGTAARSAISTFETNIRGTWNVLEACRQNAKLIQRVVVASSDKAYGAHDVLPYTESAPLQGRFPYDVSKSCADLISLSYFHTWQVPVAITRCGNLFGGGDLNFNRLIPGTIRSALVNEQPVIRSDGTFVRDYFYVEDAANAYMTLAESLPEAGCVGEAFNFGNERPMNVIEVVTKILEVMGKTHLDPIILNEASKEIPKQYLDCSKARVVLDWVPRYTFETGIAETIAWYRRVLSHGGRGAGE